MGIITCLLLALVPFTLGMSLIRTIFSHTALQVIAKLIGNLIGVVVIALLTRYLGAEGFGHYTTILAYLFFFASLSDLGLYMITITELNKKDATEQQTFFSQVYSLRFFSAGALMIIAGIVVWFLPYPAIVKQGTLIVIISMVLSLLDQLHMAWYQSRIRMYRPAIADVLGKVVLIVGVIIGIQAGVPLLPLLWVTVIAQAVHFLINLTGLARSAHLAVRYTPSAWKRIIALTWPIALSQIFVLIYFKMDTVLLSLLRPATTAQIEVGIYGAPYKVLETLIAFVPLFMGLVAPQLAKVWEQKSMNDFRAMYQHTFDAFVLATLPLVVGGVVLATPIMNLVAPGFERADTVLQILMVAIGVIFFAHLPTYTVNVIGEQKRMLGWYGFAAVLALTLYIVFIPMYSLYAAAWITVIIETFILILSWKRVYTVTRIRVSLMVMMKSCVAALCMGVVLWLIRDMTHVVFAVCIGAGVYLASVYVLRAIPKNLLKA